MHIASNLAHDMDNVSLASIGRTSRWATADLIVAYVN